jgi:hypothetical protein
VLCKHEVAGSSPVTSTNLLPNLSVTLSMVVEPHQRIRKQLAVQKPNPAS